MEESKQTIRAFVAVELSEDARAALARLQDRLKERFPSRAVRWTAPKNIHLTLHFLGDVSTAHLETVGRAVHEVTATIPTFSLDLESLGCFPNTRRPRIVWVAVSGEIDILARLRKELGRELEKGIGFQPESRPYRPHLTIGRVAKGIAPSELRILGQRIEREIPQAGHLTAIQVQQIHFIRSDLKPSGPIYTRLGHGFLKG